MVSGILFSFSVSIYCVRWYVLENYSFLPESRRSDWEVDTMARAYNPSTGKLKQEGSRDGNLGWIETSRPARVTPCFNSTTPPRATEVELSICRDCVALLVFVLSAKFSACAYSVIHKYSRFVLE